MKYKKSAIHNMHPIVTYAFSLLLLFNSMVLSQGGYAADGAEKNEDALQHFRLLLADQLKSNQATIERVFNPVGEGQSLLVRAYVSGPKELIYRPLFDETKDGSLVARHVDSFVLRTLPGTELKEVLINYEPKKNQYVFFFGNFNYSVSPDMAEVSHISAHPEAAAFLARNFQTLFIDQPLTALGVRYLYDQQALQGEKTLIQLKKAYKDSISGAVLVTSDGEIVNRYRLALYQPVDIEPEYFLEQYHLESTETVRYYIQPNGLQRYRLDETGQQQMGEWIPRQHIAPASNIGQEPYPTIATD